MRKLRQLFDNISRVFAIVAGWALLGLSIFIGIDVVGRKSFNFTLQGSDEIGGYIMAAVCAFGFSYTLAKRAHIRLNILLPRLPSALQGVANLLAYAAMAVFAYMLLWRGFDLFYESIELQAVAPTPLVTPLWIPQFFWVAGLAWFAVHVTFYLLEMLILVAKNRMAELNTIFGVETVEKETSREVQEAAQEHLKRTRDKMIGQSSRG
jgi:TRAP-type C4-dicarboxylate transport system permease small subunit